MANDDMIFAVMIYGKSKAVGTAIAESLRQFEANQAIEIKQQEGIIVKNLVVENPKSESERKSEISETAKSVIKQVRSKNVMEKVLDYITENEFAVSADLKHIGANGAVYTALNQLIDKGLVVRQGERGSYRYELANTEEEN